MGNVLTPDGDLFHCDGHGHLRKMALHWSDHWRVAHGSLHDPDHPPQIPPGAPRLAGEEFSGARIPRAKMDGFLRDADAISALPEDLHARIREHRAVQIRRDAAVRTRRRPA